jgi:hypothetical protein
MEKFETALVPCIVSRGMFPDEYAVEIKLTSGKIISLFAEASDLEDISIENSRAYLKVKLPGEQQTTGELLMYLPKESLETGSHWFEFPRAQVKQLV